MTNSFIETQKELARGEMRGMYYDDSDEFPHLLDTLITQVIQNTLEEVGRRAEPDNTVSLIAQAIREERKKVREILRKEKNTWAYQSIGWIAVDSIEEALEESLLAEMAHP